MQNHINLMRVHFEISDTVRYIIICVIYLLLYLPEVKPNFPLILIFFFSREKVNLIFEFKRLYVNRATVLYVSLLIKS